MRAIVSVFFFALMSVAAHSATAKQHMISFGKPLSVKLFVGPS